MCFTTAVEAILKKGKETNSFNQTIRDENGQQQQKIHSPIE